MIYLQAAWYYAFAWIGVQGIVVAIVVLVARWRVRAGILSMLPEHAQDQVLRARREAAHYRDLWEEASEREASLRAVVRSSIGAAGVTLMQLQGAAREMEAAQPRIVTRGRG